MSVPERADERDDAEGWAVMPNWMARDRTIEPADKIIYLLLSSRAGGHGVQAWPSQQTLASDSGFSESTVKRALKRLQQRGFITVQVVRTKHGRRNVYFLELHPMRGKRSDLGGEGGQVTGT